MHVILLTLPTKWSTKSKTFIAFINAPMLFHPFHPDVTQYFWHKWQTCVLWIFSFNWIRHIYIHTRFWSVPNIVYETWISSQKCSVRWTARLLVDQFHHFLVCFHLVDKSISFWAKDKLIYGFYNGIISHNHHTFRWASGEFEYHFHFFFFRIHSFICNDNITEKKSKFFFHSNVVVW